MAGCTNVFKDALPKLRYSLTVTIQLQNVTVKSKLGLGCH